jgi:undecaprenyl-diphosphatase
MSVRAEAGGPAAEDGTGAPTAVAPAGPSTRFLVVVGAVCLAGLVAVTVWVLLDHLRPTGWDTALHEVGLDSRVAVGTAAAVVVSATSEYLAYVAAAEGTMLALSARPWWFGAGAGVLLLAAEQGVRVAVAALIGRGRPPEGDWEMHAAGFSMPSGHTATATCAAGLLSLGLVYSVRAAWRFAVMAVLALWALVDLARRPAAAFVSAGKRTKKFWGILLGVAVLVAFVALPPLRQLTFLALGSAVAAVVYLVDVRPAVRGLQRGGNNPW